MASKYKVLSFLTPFLPTFGTFLAKGQRKNNFGGHKDMYHNIRVLKIAFDKYYLLKNEIDVSKIHIFHNFI